MKNSVITLCISPNWLLWHSSKIRIMFLSLIFWSLVLSPAVLTALDSFWIVVVTNLPLPSVVKFLINAPVCFVVLTHPSQKLLNSLFVCKSKSRLSTTKITLYIDSSSASNWLTLYDVKVLPLPVVCQIYPFFLISNAWWITASTAYFW